MASSNSDSQREAVLVTGGTTGIGLAISMRFAAEGKEVFAISRRGEDNAGDLNRAVKERGVPRPHVLKGDVSDRVRLEEIAAEMGELRCAVACGSGQRGHQHTATDPGHLGRVDPLHPRHQPLWV